MKRLSEMFGVIPGCAMQLEHAGVRTIFDLATASDLESLSRTSGVPSDLLQPWHERAVLEVASGSRRRRVFGILATVTAVLLLALATWSYLRLQGGPHTTEVRPNLGTPLSWQPSNSAGVVGYNIYRARVKGGAYVKLNSTPVVGTSYVDVGAGAGNTYYYVVTAVDRRGLESRFSNAISVTLPPRPDA
jgi:hypothetical protein